MSPRVKSYAAVDLGGAQWAGDGRPCETGLAGTERGAPVPEPGGACPGGDCAGTSSVSTAVCWTGCGRQLPPATDGSTPSVSTAGPSTTACWTPTAPCSATRCTTATPARRASPNELGLDGSVRYLRNIMGLWSLQECVRAREEPDLGLLLREAATVPTLRSVVDGGGEAFPAPGRMPERIPEACRASGQPVPGTRAEVTRCILDSLALAHRRCVEDAQRLADHAVDVVYIAGGGTRNALLCQLTADACGLPVVAGVTEAAAPGNVLVQGRAHGLVGDLPAMRRLLTRTQPLTRYAPRGGTARWRGGRGAARRPVSRGLPPAVCAHYPALVR
ncbi:FGGY-family carbohydrate kinase [Streptomyces sp. NPDC006314]|uniref:FGGY-family carbohydrate kinase n=1 Tax=Streptomyces sp. NPDC006314 TaxID=3154475 RepID=UPI0033A2E741